jgi:hypothetical protein
MNSKRDDGLERIVRDAAPARFRTGFVERVNARLANERARSLRITPDFTAVLERQFLRIVPILAAASLILGLYSWWGGRTTSDSVLDATLNLPRVSIATAYEPELLYGDAGGEY